MNQNAVAFADISMEEVKSADASLQVEGLDTLSDSLLSQVGGGGVGVSFG